LLTFFGSMVKRRHFLLGGTRTGDRRPRPDGRDGGANLAAAKLSLLREAVRDNVEPPRRALRIVVGRPARVFPLWALSLSLIGTLVYLSHTPTEVSRVRAASASTRVATKPDPPPRFADEPAVASRLPAPHRLARGVLPLSVRRIVIDAGHGGTHLGAVSDEGLTEKEMTLDISLRLGRMLRAAPFEVLLTRETDATMSLRQRAAFANAARADLFVSVHVNWIPHRGVRPIETYYVGPSDDPDTLRLARLENRDSGYSLASYRQLLERIYLDTRRDESQALARQVNGELYRSLSAVNPALRNWGVKMAPFAVLVGTEMPAVLVEVSCLSNQEEVELLATADYREQIAAALARGIRSYANELERVGRREG
jgi:N-acetylmuramoyl-L-alanine amidase